MRIVIDLQGAQTGSRHRGIGRYSLSLAQAMVQNRGHHEVIIALNGLFPNTIEPIRASFEGMLPQENIRVWFATGPVHSLDTENSWRRHAAELIRETFLASLQPDIIHITSLFEGFGDNAVHSIGLTSAKLANAVTFYDVIPLIQSDVYLKPNPTYEVPYREKLAYLKRADIYLAISESSRQECIDHLGATFEQVVNIGSAVEADFKPVYISEVDEFALRKQFGLTRRFLMYSGATDERKNHLRLIKAFSLLPANLRNSLQLVIVGGLPAAHREKFEVYTKYCGLTPSDVVITGRVTDEEMVRFYNLCELFVFPSWHEGFGLPALEAMSCGAPVIGSNITSLPEVIGREDALFDPFSESDIAQKIAEVVTNDHLRADLARHSLEQAKKFSWDRSAKKALAALECWYVKQPREYISIQNNLSCSELVPALIDNILKLGTPSNEDDLLRTAQAINQDFPASTEKQLFLDISQLVILDSKSGVQRVVRSILRELLANPPQGYRVEPIFGTPHEMGYRYARSFTQRFLNYPGVEAKDELVVAYIGDIFFGLDLNHSVVKQNVDYYQHLRRIGVQVFFLVHDLLPVLMPNYFWDDITNDHANWLVTVAQADGVVCVSRTVAEEFVEVLKVLGNERLRPFKIGWSHNAANFDGSVPTKGLTADADYVLSAISHSPTFLMVGTIEPRKGQMQTLAAFEQLWDQGLDVNLVIVGKCGWNVELLIELLRIHSERNRRLFWLDDISDEYLEKVYAASTCLIAASAGEGFGLPLIEAAYYKLPIIARDIPVFREVAGTNAFYFSGLEPEVLANAVREWLVLDKAGQAPKSDIIPWLTWKESTKNLLDVILGGQWYRQWMPDKAHRFWGADSRLGTQVGKRIGRDMVSGGRAGYLIFGPYIPLAAGEYRVMIHGTVGKSGLANAHMDVAYNKNIHILGESALSKPDDGCLVTLPISLDESCTDLEVRVWVSEKTDLHVSMIEIVPWQGEQESRYSDSEKITEHNVAVKDTVSIKPAAQQKRVQVMSFDSTVTESTQDRMLEEVEARVAKPELTYSSGLVQPAHSKISGVFAVIDDDSETESIPPSAGLEMHSDYAQGSNNALASGYLAIPSNAQKPQQPSRKERSLAKAKRKKKR